MCHIEASDPTTPQEFLAVVLYSVNLTKLEFHLPKFPFLYGSGLELARKEICIIFERWKWSSKVSVGPCVPLCTWCWAAALLCWPGFTASPMGPPSSVPLNPDQVHEQQRAPEFSADSCVIRVRGGEKQMWIPVVLSSFIFSFSSLLSALLTGTCFKPTTRFRGRKPSLDFLPDSASA